MMISKNKYKELKPFYDYQRQKQYQKDWLRGIFNKVQKVASDTGGGFIQYDDDKIIIDDMFYVMEEKDWQTVPKNYVPDNPDWRIEGEDYEKWCETRKNIQFNNQYVWA